MVAWRYIVSSVTSQAVSIDSLDIGAHDSTFIRDAKTTIIVRNISVSTWAILMVSNSFGSFSWVEIGLFKSLSSSMALISTMNYERISSEFIYVFTIDTICAHISHTKSYSLMVMSSIYLPV